MSGCGCTQLPMVRRCVICGSTRRVEANHAGGRNHVAWFTIPLCGEHHDRFHVLVRQAGVDLRYTPAPIERIRRALAATKIFEWMLLEQLKCVNQSRRTKAS
jgi:hypothetical protein